MYSLLVRLLLYMTTSPSVEVKVVLTSLGIVHTTTGDRTYCMEFPRYSWMHSSLLPERGTPFATIREHAAARAAFVVADFYLIPFATHAFVLECQENASELPSLSVFPMISTDFTPTP
jgi:hypothetical protein